MQANKKINKDLKQLPFKDSMQSNLSIDEIIQEIAEADSAISDSDLETLNIWLKSKIEPVQYKFNDNFWVVATLNNSCLYFNFVEEGWG